MKHVENPLQIYSCYTPTIYIISNEHYIYIYIYLPHLLPKQWAQLEQYSSYLRDWDQWTVQTPVIQREKTIYIFSNRVPVLRTNYKHTFCTSNISVNPTSYIISVFYHIEECKSECGDVVFAMLVVHDFVHHHQSFHGPLLMFCDRSLVLLP